MLVSGEEQAALAALKTLCPGLRNFPPDSPHGCAVIDAGFWMETFFSALDQLPSQRKGDYLLTRNITRALSVLMVDFSCALKLAMPLSVLSAMGEASRFHITVKGGKYLEAVGRGYEAATLGSGIQEPLNRSGDDVRIDWGRLYLAVEPAGSVAAGEKQDRVFIQAQIPLEEGREALFALAYRGILGKLRMNSNLSLLGQREQRFGDFGNGFRQRHRLCFSGQTIHFNFRNRKDFLYQPLHIFYFFEGFRQHFSCVFIFSDPQDHAFNLAF